MNIKQIIKKMFEMTQDTYQNELDEISKIPTSLSERYGFSVKNFFQFIS